MSCEGHRTQYFQLVASLAAGADAGQLEHLYQTARNRPAKNEAEQRIAEAKTRHLFADMQRNGIKPPTHAKNGLPKKVAQRGYAAVYDTLKKQGYFGRTPPPASQNELFDPDEIIQIGQKLQPLIGDVIRASTEADVRQILDEKGVMYEVGYSDWKVKDGGLPEPIFRLSGYRRPVEIRAHFGPDKTAFYQFRLGTQIVTTNVDVRPFPGYNPDPSDEPTLRAADQALVTAFGKPRQDRDPYPKGWNGEYIDQKGWVYFDNNGKLVGLRAESGHIKRSN